MIKSLLIFTICGLIALSRAQAAAPFIGINTNESVNFNASLPYVDLFRMAEPFKESSLTKGNIQYDAQGWVRNLNGGQAGSYFIRWMPEQALPAGNYTVRYQGKGSLSYPHGVQVLKRSPGMDIIRLIANPGNQEVSASVLIKQTDPRDPIRQIRILMPGGICQNNPYQHVSSPKQCRGTHFSAHAQHSGNIRFNPDYLNFMRQFRTLRFMNMSGITRNPIQHWAQRPTLDKATWGGKEGQRGAPIEVMVALANQLNAHAWFNIPHRADDDFIRRYAQYVRQHLRPHLRVYLEYSNETWNGKFHQAHYARQQGRRLGLATDPQRAAIEFNGLRSKQLFQIWDQVFAGRPGLIKVISGWFGRPDLTPYFLKAADVYRHADVFAVGAYFYAHQKALMQTQSVNDVFNLLNSPQQPYGLAAAKKNLQRHAQLIKPYKLQLMAYEGGQHLVHYGTRSKADHPNPLLAAANNDARMTTAYTQLLRDFRGVGGQLFMAFSAPRPHAFFGFWGVKEHIRQPDSQAPKLRALQNFQR